MRTHVMIIACMVSFAFLLAVPSAMAQADKLIGVWKMIEVKYLNPQQNQVVRTITNPPPGIVIFTKKHFSSVGVTGDKHRPSLPENPTDAQLLEAWRPFVGLSGTYEVKGSTLTVKIMVAKNPLPSNEPSTESWNFRFEGDMFITADPKGRWEVKYTRLE